MSQADWNYSLFDRAILSSNPEKPFERYKENIQCNMN